MASNSEKRDYKQVMTLIPQRNHATKQEIY